MKTPITSGKMRSHLLGALPVDFQQHVVVAGELLLDPALLVP